MDPESEISDYDEESIIFSDFYDELSEIIADEVGAWFLSSFFPIYINDREILPCMTNFGEIARLCDENIVNTVIEQKLDVEGYEYAFLPDFKGIILYDKNRDVLFKLIFSEDVLIEDIPISFKGVKIEDFEFNKLVPYLDIRHIDIFSGSPGDCIDASRTCLKTNLLAALQDVAYSALFVARKIYVCLLEEILDNKKRMEFLSDCFKIRENAMKKEVKTSCIMSQMFRVEDKYFSASKKIPLCRRVLVYKMAYRLVDAQLLRDFELLQKESKNAVGNLEWIKKVRFPALLDGIVKHHKSNGRRSFDDSFHRKYFDKEIEDIVRRYMNLWGIILTECLRGKNTGFKEIELIRKLVNEVIKEQMLYVSTWRKMRGVGEIVIGAVGAYSNIKGFWNEFWSEMISILLLWPTSAKDFREWEYEGGYADNKVLALEISGWYRSIIMMLLDGTMDIDDQVKNLWRKTLENTLYGHVSCDSPQDLTIIKLLEQEKIVKSLGPYMEEKNKLPFLFFMPITKIDFNSGNWLFTYKFSNREKEIENGYNVSGETKRAVYKELYEEILNIYDSVYMNVIGFSEYREIILFSKDSDYKNMIHDLHTYEYAYIPLCANSEEIKRFIEDMDENYIEWLDSFVQKKQFKRVTKYICRKKHGRIDAGKLLRIEQCYKDFMTELLEAWYEFKFGL